MNEALTVYAVRNAKGEWMRSTGMGGGKHWVTNVCDAKLYTKLSQARGRVTFWANAYPATPHPQIVAFTMLLTDAKVLEETDRVAQAKMKKATSRVEQVRRDARRRLEEAKATIQRAEAEIQSIRKGAW